MRLLESNGCARQSLLWGSGVLHFSRRLAILVMTIQKLSLTLSGPSKLKTKR